MNVDQGYTLEQAAQDAANEGIQFSCSETARSQEEIRFTTSQMGVSAKFCVDWAVPEIGKGL